MYFSLTAEKCVPVQDTETMMPAFIVDMKGSVSVHAVEVLARSDNNCKFVVSTNILSLILTGRKLSCGKVMFSQMPVCSRGGFPRDH